jgi:hypothetical protein
LLDLSKVEGAEQVKTTGKVLVGVCGNLLGAKVVAAALEDPELNLHKSTPGKGELAAEAHTNALLKTMRKLQLAQKKSAEIVGVGLTCSQKMLKHSEDHNWAEVVFCRDSRMQ